MERDETMDSIVSVSSGMSGMVRDDIQLRREISKDNFFVNFGASIYDVHLGNRGWFSKARQRKQHRVNLICDKRAPSQYFTATTIQSVARF